MFRKINYYLLINSKIRINNLDIPFETLFIDKTFNIVFKLRRLLISKYIIFPFIDLINDEDKLIIESIKTILNENEYDESQFINDKNYSVLKKQLNESINYLTKNKITKSFQYIKDHINKLSIKYEETLKLQIKLKETKNKREIESIKSKLNWLT